MSAAELDALDRGVIEAGTLAARALAKAEAAEKHAEALLCALHIMGSATGDRALVAAMAEALPAAKLAEIRARARELEAPRHPALSVVRS